MPIDFDRLVNVPVVAIFGEPAFIQRLGYQDKTINGVFNSKYYALDDAGQVGGSALITTFAFRVADLDPLPLGLLNLVPSDTNLTIRGVIYRITDLKPDGQGMAVAELERLDAP